MDNVYDYIADFYDNDEGWNTILDRSYAEGFIRKEAWQGHDNKQLQEIWNRILLLCVYTSHGEFLLGDLNTDDLIDAVAWCGRNVADYTLSPARVKNLLETWGELFVYLKEKHVVSSSVHPHLAKEALIKEDGTLALVNFKGEFLPGEEQRRAQGVEDAPSKVILNVGEVMNDLLDELHTFFQQNCFNLDLERAVFFYQGFSRSKLENDEMESSEFWQTFWDYFLFDYHLLLDDKTPLEHFAGRKVSRQQALVTELCGSRLALFSVEEIDETGMHLCRDFLTDELYTLNLPLNRDMDTKDMLILGHIFYNKTMVMNYVRCFRIKTLGQKRLKEQLLSFYHWYKIQEPRGTIESFIARHPLILRKAVFFSAHYFPFVVFPYTTDIAGYVPPPFSRGKNTVVSCMEKMMTPQHFSCRDVLLVMRMWLDFSAVHGDISSFTPEVWAGGVLASFVKLNMAYSYSLKNIAAMCWNIPVEDLTKAALKVQEVLQLTDYDPRYCNEEGVLTMLLNQTNV